MTLIAFGLWLGLSTSSSMVAQTAASPSIGARDATAVALIQRALTAMGGEALVGSVRAVQTQSTVSRVDGSTPTNVRSFESISGSTFAFRKEASNGSNTRVFVSGKNSPQLSTGGQQGRTLAHHMAIGAPPIELPAVLLYAELHDPAFAIRTMSSPSPGSPPAIEITNSSNLLTQAVVRQDWYFDPSSGVPIRVEYNLPDNDDALNSIRAICDFLGYQQISGVSFPTLMDVYEAGKRVALVTVSSTQLNPSISPSQFDLQGGGVQ